MGKGNRTRNNYQDAYNMSGASGAKAVKAKAQKADKTGFWTTFVIVVLIVASLALWFFTASGVVARGTTVISTDNYDVDANMVTYYENQLFSTAFNQYYSYYYQYFTNGDANTAYTYAQQAMQGKTIASYYDEALDMLKEVLILCESANAAGMTLDAEDLEAVNSLVAQYDGTLKQNFGAGVSKSDIRKAVELQALASKYYEELDKTTRAAVTEADMNAYIEANKPSFYVADYLTAEVGVLAENYADDKEGFAAAKALVDEYATKLEAAKTADEFKTLIVEYTVKSGFDALASLEIDSDLMPDNATLNTYEQNAIDNIARILVVEKLSEEQVETQVTEKGSIEEAMSTIEATLLEDCRKIIDGASASQAYLESTDEYMTDDIKWLISEERAVGDTKKNSVSDDAEYTFTVYMIEKPLYIYDTITRNVGHIYFNAPRATATQEELDAALAKAEKVLAEFKSGDQTEESFEELGWANTNDSSVFYNNVVEGDMTAEFDSWLFDEARVEGETAIVQTGYGFHVMLYRGEETIADANAKAGVVSEKYSEYLKANESKVVINEKAAHKYGE